MTSIILHFVPFVKYFFAFSVERVYYTAFFLVRQVLLRKYHAAFTQIAQYFRVELQNCCETIQASGNFHTFFQIITKLFAIQRKKGYTKRKKKKTDKKGKWNI